MLDRIKQLYLRTLDRINHQSSTHAIDQSKTNKPNAEEIADRWLKRNKSLVLRQTPFWAQSLTGLVLGLACIATVGSLIIRVDEVITVSGQLESITGSTAVKTPVGGRVSEIYFKDGQHVKKGQLLVRFDTREASNRKSTLTKLIDLEKRDLASRLSILDGKRKVLQRKVSTFTSITEELRNLVEAGGFQKIQYLEQLDVLYELQNQLTSIELDISMSKLASQKSIGQMQNELKQSELQLQYQNVTSPVTGIIFDPKAQTDGVLQSGETILTLIPQTGLQALVFVPNKDIGLVEPGQSANVRVDAFPFTRYGELVGKISQIGADALAPDKTAGFYRYPVKLSLKRAYLETNGVKVPLRSGMSVNANIKLRDKRLISLVSDIFVDQTESIKSIRQQ